MKFSVIMLALFFVPNVWAQENARLELKGKVTSSIATLDGIYVVNTKTEKYTSTTDGGYFSIAAKPGDTLMFSSIQFKGKQIAIKAEDFKPDLFMIRLEPMVHELDEVVIDRYDNINAVSLGIVPAGQKSYTPAERKLKVASSYAGEYGKTAIGLDPIFNALSGRTAMLRKEVEVEKKETMMKHIEDWFEEKYFVEQLKIPSEYVHGFLYYVAENDRFATVLNSKNKTTASFLLAQMAVKYKDTIACDAEK